MNPQMLKGTVDMLTLALLNGRRMHGYEIAKALRTLSGDAIRLKQGTLYPTLHRLEAAGLIQGDWQDQRGLPSRRVYSITGSGLTAFDTRRAEWGELQGVVRMVLEGAEQLTNA